MLDNLIMNTNWILWIPLKFLVSMTVYFSCIFPFPTFPILMIRGGIVMVPTKLHKVHKQWITAIEMHFLIWNSQVILDEAVFLWRVKKIQSWYSIPWVAVAGWKDSFFHLWMCIMAAHISHWPSFLDEIMCLY